MAEWKPKVTRVSADQRERMIFANSLIRERKFEEAKQELEALLAKDPNSYSVHMGLGLVLQAQGQYESAAQYFQRAKTLDPMQAQPLYLAGICQLRLGDLDKAEKLLSDAAKLDPKLPAIHVGLAQLANRKNDYTKAISHLSDALELDPQLTPARMLRARLLNRSGDNDSAVTDIEELLESRPDHRGATVMLANWYDQQGMHEKGAGLLLQALERKADDPSLWTTLGRLRSNAGDHAAAESSYREALKLRPKRLASKVGLVEALIPQGKVGEAREILKTISRRGPMAVIVHRLSGEAFFAEGKYREAVESYRAALMRRKNADAVLESLDKEPKGNGETDWLGLAEEYRAEIKKVQDDTRTNLAEKDWQPILDRYRPVILRALTARAARRSAGQRAVAS